MQEAVPVTRPLQNHLPLLTHFTTEAALWMPQYLLGRHAHLGLGPITMPRRQFEGPTLLGP